MVSSRYLHQIDYRQICKNKPTMHLNLRLREQKPEKNPAIKIIIVNNEKQREHQHFTIFFFKNIQWK